MIGKATLKQTAEKLAAGMVAKEAARIGAAQEGKALAADVVQRMAVANVAANIGAKVGIGAQAFGMEGGEIMGGLAEQSARRGSPLTGAEIAKGLGATLAAGGLEFVGDKIGVDLMLGKSALFKPAAGMTGIGGRAARAGVGAVGAIPAEAGTEYFQTGIEEYGQGKEANILPWNQSAEAQRQAFDAAGLGGVGGGAMAVGGGLLSSPVRQRATPADVATATTPEAATAAIADIGSAIAGPAPVAESLASTQSEIDALLADPIIESAATMPQTPAVPPMAQPGAVAADPALAPIVAPSVDASPVLAHMRERVAERQAEMEQRNQAAEAGALQGELTSTPASVPARTREESQQERSDREFAENYDRVQQDIPGSSTKDLYRAVIFADKAIQRLNLKAQRGEPYNAAMRDSLISERDYLKGEWEKREDRFDQPKISAKLGADGTAAVKDSLTPEAAKPKGAAVLAYRQQAAAQKFIESAGEQFGLSPDDAGKAWDHMVKAKLINVDSLGGQYTMKDGRLWDGDVLRRAAGIEQQAAEKSITRIKGGKLDIAGFSREDVVDTLKTAKIVATVTAGKDGRVLVSATDRAGNPTKISIKQQNAISNSRRSRRHPRPDRRCLPERNVCRQGCFAVS